MKLHSLLFAAALSLSVAAVAAAPPTDAPAADAPAAEAGHDHAHSHSPNAEKKRVLRPVPKNATPREKELLARIDRAIASLTLKADEYWHNGNYEGVAFCNRMITQLDPHDVLAWSDLGWILWAGLDNNAEAEKALRAGVAANPKRHDLYYDLGFFLYRSKRYHEAAATLHKGTRLPDADAVTWNLYAHSLERMGRPEQAADTWREMRKQFPDAVHPQVNLDRLKRKELIK